MSTDQNPPPVTSHEVCFFQPSQHVPDIECRCSKFSPALKLEISCLESWNEAWFLPEMSYALVKDLAVFESISEKISLSWRASMLRLLCWYHDERAVSISTGSKFNMACFITSISRKLAIRLRDGNFLRVALWQKDAQKVSYIWGSAHEQLSIPDSLD